MTRQEAIELLEYHNRWRHDVHLKSPDPRKIEEAIETVIRLVIEYKEIIDFYEANI